MGKTYSYITELKAHKLTVLKMLDLASLYLQIIKESRQIQVITDPKSINSDLSGITAHIPDMVKYSHILKANGDLPSAMAHIPDVLKYDRGRIITITLSNHTFMLSHAINVMWLVNGVIRECDLWVQDITDWGTVTAGAQVLNEACKESLSRFKYQLNDVVTEIEQFINQAESFMLGCDNMASMTDKDT
jgi:hypothetical protein